MQRSRRNADVATFRKPHNHAPKSPVDAAPQTDNALSLSSAYSFVQRAADTPAPALAPAISRLQGTVGNQAVQRILGKGKKKESKDTGMMTYAEFRRLSGQDAKHATTARLFNTKGNKRAHEMEDILSGRVGVEQLADKRKKLGHDLKATGSKELTPGSAYAQQADVNFRFMKYEADPSIKHLIELYQSINFFRTMFNGMDFLKLVEGVFNTLTRQIEAELKAETEKQGGSVNDANTLLTATPNANPTPMPDFLEEIGVPQAYYDEHIAPNQDIVDALEHYYVELKAGHHYQANKARLKLQGVRGMEIVMSLFTTQFPEQAGLGGVVGTDSEEEGELTPVEQAAILTYSGGHYDEMNTQLRQQQNRRKGIVIGEKNEDRRRRDQHVFENRSRSKLAVKGMNKLPKYTGITYRASPDFPLDTIKPGASFSVNNFWSTTPSIFGIDNFGGGGANVTFVMHSKTGVNIVAFSGAAAEAEVLFRPGTKFTILNLWRTNNYLVPTDAPPAVQMIMHTQVGNARLRGKESACIEMAEA